MDGVNHVEYVFVKDLPETKEDDGDDGDDEEVVGSYCTDVSTHDMHRVLNAMQKSAPGIKPQQRTYIEYKFRTMVYETNTAQDVRVFKKDVVAVYDDEENPAKVRVIRIASNRQKASAHCFPSTTKMHSHCKVDEVSFRVHHRVHVVCARRTYKDGEECNRISLVYAHDDRMETQLLNGIVAKYLGVIRPILDAGSGSGSGSGSTS
jgi:hypothetical protein